MDFLHEGLALGVDLIILGLCVKEYVSYKKYINLLKSAPQLPIDSNLKKYVAERKDQGVPYAVIKGVVKPIGLPIHSVMTPSVTGVLQVIKLSEHRVARGFAGFWTEQHKLLHVAYNEMPFELRNNDNDVSVEVMDAFSAAVLDLDVVYDNYEPSSLSLFDHIIGFFSGVRQRGLQTTEELLRDGSFITAVGALELDGNTLRLQPSPVGPLFLTTASKTTLIKKFEEAKSSMAFKIFMCSTVLTVLLSVIIRKIYFKKKHEREELRIRTTLEKERKARRARSRPQHLKSEQLCVVCSVNPKEVIILPCGHVCVCEDCAERIQNNCPVCRGKINTKAAAFIV